MPTKTDHFAPYTTPEEMVRGKRRAALMLAIGAAAAVLAVVARRYVDDERLVRVYVAAAVMHLIAALGPIVRIWRSEQLEPVDPA